MAAACATNTNPAAKNEPVSAERNPVLLSMRSPKLFKVKHPLMHPDAAQGSDENTDIAECLVSGPANPSAIVLPRNAAGHNSSGVAENRNRDSHCQDPGLHGPAAHEEEIVEHAHENDRQQRTDSAARFFHRELNTH